jgi:hypothetical protein
MRTACLFAALVAAVPAVAAPRPGAEAELTIRYDGKRGDSPVYWLPTSRAALDDLGTYYNAKDSDGLVEMIRRGRLVEYTTAKVKVRVIEFNDAGIGRVRLLDGPGKGKEVWCFDRDFKD